jgi:shikimate kinase
MNIYLAGLIGVGKTTLGQLLAHEMGWKYADLDEAMKRDAGKDFRQVVEEEGWLGFRQREYRICKQFAQMQATVVGLGGGTVRYDWNVDVLRNTGINILLVADLHVLAERVRQNDRPRVNSGVSLEEDLLRIWQTSQDLYLSFADIVYRTDQGKSLQQEAVELKEMVLQHGSLQSQQPGL